MSINEQFELAKRKGKENDFLAAIEILNELIKIEANNESYIYERGVAYLNVEKFDLAMYDFNRLVDLDSERAFYYSCRGFIKSRIGDKNGALDDYEVAIRLEPNNPITYNNMGLVFEEMGYMEQAQKSFKIHDDLKGYKPRTFDEPDAVPAENNEIKSDKVTENIPTKGQIAKDVFTKKNTFKEFVQFIKNGFKLKHNSHD